MSMFPRSWSPVVTSTLYLLLVAGASGQQHPNDPIGEPVAPPAYNSMPTLHLTVFSGPKTRLDRQALIRVQNNATQVIQWQTTQTDSEVTFADLPVGRYDIEVSAAGYVTAHQDLFVGSSFATYRVDITLKPDPSAVDLDAPIASEMPSRARKETQRGVAALKSGNLKEAQKRLDAAYKQVPTSPEVNFLLGYLFLERRDLDHAKTYLNTAASLDPRNGQALTLLGRVLLQQQDYEAAGTSLEQAIAVDRDSWVAHKLLADTYLMRREFEKAREQAQIAIEKGKGAGSAAQLALGEALANLGRDQEAVAVLKAYLQETPGAQAAPQVRDLIAQLEGRVTKPTGSAELTSLAAHSQPVTESLVNSDDLKLSTRTWEPRGIDEVKPTVAADVTCPYEQVMDKSGQRVKVLVDDVARFTAIEELEHEDLDELGHPTSKEARRFNYSVDISESQPGYLGVDEYRSGYSGPIEFPNNIVTRGVPALALIFHPTMRGNYQMTCEGLGEWHGKATWLVHFRQRDDRPSRIHAYKIGPEFYSVNLKGRAWIAADNFQIVRIESELVSPMPKIQLLSEHQVVEYGPVQFPKKNTELWLPKSAELYFHFRRHRYFRRHSFDHFMLFSVESEEQHKVRKPEN
jgi:tetratricopeptide (TPR) repeat protein